MRANTLKGTKEMAEILALLGSICSIACFIIWVVEKLSKAIRNHKHQKSNRLEQR